MAHMLVDDGSMAYAVSGGRPWHGLGIPIVENLPPEEFVTRCKLGWDVDLVPMPPEINGIKMPEGRNMLVRPAIYEGETQSICLDIVGKKFKPVQNLTAARVFSEYVEEGKMTMETAGALRGGKVVWFLAKTTESFELAGGDKVDGYFLLMSPHEMGKSLICKFVLTRVVCANTLAISMGEAGITGEWRMRHSRELNAAAIEEMKISLGIKSAMSTYREQATLLMNTRMTERDNVVYLARVFDPKMLVSPTQMQAVDKETGKVVKFPVPKTMDAVANLPVELVSGKSLLKRAAKSFNDQPGFELGRGTAWNAFNGVTNFLDNISSSKAENRMYNSVLGRNIATKNRAMELALAIAA